MVSRARCGRGVHRARRLPRVGVGEDGRWLPKGEAARWAMGRLDDPSVVGAALARRSDPAAPAPDPAGVAEVVGRAGAALAGG